MIKIIRAGGMRRYALAFIVLFGSLAGCLGQGQAAAGQDAAKPDAPSAAATVPAPAAQETPPAAAPAPAQTSGTSPSQPQATSKIPAKKGKSPVGSGQVSTTGVQEKPYEIGPGDVLNLNVMHVPDVSQSLEVRPDGYVSVRFAGELLAAGKTAPQLAALIAEKLKTYYNDPEVNVQVVQIRSKKFFISGEVRKAGSFPLTTPTTVFEALIEAGGPAEFAHINRIYVLRGKTKIQFNYKEVSKGNHLDQNILLENGDVIVVP